MSPDESCRLCEGPSELLGLGKSDNRLFLLCNDCSCVFVARAGLPSPSEEKSRYDQHQNDSTPEYRAFLSRLADPLVRVLKPNAKGLDFGSGPVPVLSQLLQERGFEMVHYDPYYFPDKMRLEGTYDFITCSETAEHFHQPKREFERLHALLKPGGFLGVMTQMRAQWDGFFEWYYPRDPTHVMFYSPKTMRWIARRFSYAPQFYPEGVVVFQKT